MSDTPTPPNEPLSFAHQSRRRHQQRQARLARLAQKRIEQRAQAQNKATSAAALILAKRKQRQANKQNTDE